METIDLGHRPNDEIAPSPEREDKIYYPELHISNVDVDDDMDVGDECVAKVRLTKTAIRKDEYGKSCTYQVKSISFQKPEVKEFGDALDALMQKED